MSDYTTNNGNVMDRGTITSIVTYDFTLTGKIKAAEDEEDARHPRPRIGPKIEPPWWYWKSLAEAYMWMKQNGIKHWTEKGRA